MVIDNDFDCFVALYSDWQISTLAPKMQLKKGRFGITNHKFGKVSFLSHL